VIRRQVLWLVVLLCVQAGLTPPLAAQAPPDAGGEDDAPVVLVLMPLQPGRPAFELLARGIQRELRSAPERPRVAFELLYGITDSESLHEQQLAFMRSRYARQRVAVVVALIQPRYLQVREQLGLPPTTPIVFVSLEPTPLPTHATGLVAGLDLSASFDFVAPLLTELRDVAVVGGAASFDHAINAPVLAYLPSRVAPGRVIDLTGLPLAEMRARVSDLPASTPILLGTSSVDGEGRLITDTTVMATLSPIARGPIIVSNESGMGRGALGGRLRRIEHSGSEAGRTALAILRGTPVASLPIRVLPTTPTLDARQMRRFGIAESRVPPGTHIEFRTPGVWETSGRWVFAAALVLVLQSTLIVGLVAEHRRRRASERQLDARLRSQALIADVSSDFADLPLAEDLEAHVAASLAHVGEVIGAAECGVWNLREDPPRLVGRWRREGGMPGASMLDQALLAWARPRLLDGQEVSVDDISEVLEAAQVGETADAVAVLLLPLRVDGREVGALSVRHVRAHAWDADTTGDLRTIGEIVAAAVVRKGTDASMREQLATLAHVNRVAGLGELAGSLAHELNQPLTAILSNAEVAHQLLAHPRPPVAQVREILDDVIADNDRACEIIRNMRLLLKKQALQPVPVDVNATVSEVTRLVAHDARLRGGSIEVRPGSDLPPVVIDPTQLKQVLLNLMVNAVDAVTGQQARGAVEVSTAARDGGVVIEFRDAGPGIPALVHARLFEPFFTTKPRGLGVGLSIARSIVETAGGRITAANLPEGGAYFQVWLPAAPTE
jgi:C4-dicarboxylate-specific signal transduction histidine kinase